MIPESTVLATGGSGFIGSHSILQLLILRELGKMKNATNEKAKRVLGWAPRSNEEAIFATGESLVRLGLLKDSGKKAA